MFDIPALQKVPCCVKELVDYNIKPTSNSLHFVYELIVGYDSSGYQLREAISDCAPPASLRIQATKEACHS
jgi:hypothetical protein